MVPKDLDKLIEKYLEGRCTEAERAVVESLYSALGDKPPALSSDLTSQTDEQRAHRILASVKANMRAMDEDDGHRSRFWRYAGIAASLLFLITVGYYIFKPDIISDTRTPGERIAEALTVIENQTVDRKRVILPDGTLVQMSPQSEIRYAPHNNGLSRELFLKGEAYFDVAHNPSRPFYVYAGNVVTKVLGTSFIVRAGGEDEKVTVSVKTGKVSVYSRKASHKKTVLTPNEEAVYDNATDLVARQEAHEQKADQERIALTEMHFEEAPIPDVLDMLSKTYAIEIVFDADALSECVLTSSFYDEGLYDRIDVICTAIGATYSVADARIHIESKGCNLKPGQL